MPSRFAYDVYTNDSFLRMHCHHCMVHDCHSLHILKTIILNFLSDSSQIFTFLGSYGSFISPLCWCYRYLIFHDPWFLILVSAYLSNQVPDLTSSFGHDSLHQSKQFGCLGVSAGNDVGLVIIVSLGVKWLFKLWGWRWGAGVPLAENHWIGLLAWFPTQVRL